MSSEADAISVGRSSDKPIKVVVIARKVERIGVQALEQCGDQFFVTLKNRTYKTRVPIPKEKAKTWKRLLS